MQWLIQNGLLTDDQPTQTMEVIQACYASWLPEPAMKWLIQNGLITD